LTKLDIMREQMGTDRVYDLIDELLEDVPLIHLIEKSIDSEDGAAAASQTEDSLKSGFEDRASMLLSKRNNRLLPTSIYAPHWNCETHQTNAAFNPVSFKGSSRAPM
jgi:hypothetical protein